MIDKRSHKKMDQDIKALSQSVKGLSKSSTRRMLLANLNFLMDYFIYHPSKEIPRHLQED
jgi:hypothetical protein